MFGLGNKPQKMTELERAGRLASGENPDAMAKLNRSVERRIEQGTATISDLISAPMMSIEDNYIVHPEGLCSVMVVAFWPSTISVGWFRQVMYMLREFKADVAMHIHPVPRNYIEYYLQQKSRAVGSSIEAAQERGKDVKSVYTDQMSDIQIMQQAVMEEKQNFFQMTMTVTVYGDDKADLAENLRKTRSLFADAGIDVKPFIMQQRQGIETALPLGVDSAKAFHNFYTSALATGFPFMSSGLREPDGVCYGNNDYTGLPIFFNNFTKKGGGGFNKVVVGTTGYGKSFWTKVMASRYAIRGVDVMVIDPSPKEEYKNFCDYLGGTQVEISTTGRAVLNPFDLARVQERLASTAEGDTYRPNVIAEKMAFLQGLFALMGNNALTAIDLVMLDQLTGLLYELSGIIAGDESTYGNTPPTMEDFDRMLNVLHVVANLGEKERGDLRKRIEGDPAQAVSLVGRTFHWYEERRSTGNTYSRDEIDAVKHLRTILNPYLTGFKAGFFRGQSTVRADSGVTVFRVGDNKDEDQMALAMYIVFGEIYNRVLTGGGGRNKLVVIDEAWKLLTNHATAAPVQSLIREGRKMGTGTWILSQKPADFLDTPDGVTAVTQSGVLVMLNTAKEQVRRAEESGIWSFPASVADNIPRLTKGRGIMQIDGKTTVAFRLVPTIPEMAMASTTESDFEEPAAEGDTE